MTAITLPPLPDSLSAEAHAQITAMQAAPAAAMSLAGMREQMLAIQHHVSGFQLAMYAVDVSDDVIAGVPVRVFEPRGGMASRMRSGPI